MAPSSAIGSSDASQTTCEAESALQGSTDRGQAQQIVGKSSAPVCQIMFCDIWKSLRAASMSPLAVHADGPVSASLHIRICCPVEN
jgi:hypothetical protein